VTSDLNQSAEGDSKLLRMRLAARLLSCRYLLNFLLS